jgi:imidazolonepropionase-like amidohydrolase
MGEVLHVRGRVLMGCGDEGDDVRDELWSLDGRVTLTRPDGDHDVTTLEGWALPGLVDAHCHVGLNHAGAVDDPTSEQQATTDREAGTLLIRDAGSPADTRWVDDRADLPRIVRAGRHIARTRRYIRNFAHEIEPDQLVGQVVAEAKVGDGWVKLVGDWIDRGTGDLAPCWPRDALEAAIAAAHEHGARVTAHCFAESSLTDLVEAGIDCVEHATGLTEETIGLFVDHDVAIVPTLVNISTFPRIVAPAAERFPAYAQHMLALHARRYATIRAAHEAGVRVYAGTDAGGSLPHGLIASEVRELTLAGLTPAQALDAACWGARSWLGRPGLQEGASADLVVYDADPREDVAVLEHPRAVVLRGVRR